MAFGLPRANWLNIRDIRFPTYVVLIYQRHRQTDGRTERRTSCNRNTALCTKVHRAVKIDWK